MSILSCKILVFLISLLYNFIIANRSKRERRLETPCPQNIRTKIKYSNIIAENLESNIIKYFIYPESEYYNCFSNFNLSLRLDSEMELPMIKQQESNYYEYIANIPESSINDISQCTSYQSRYHQVRDCNITIVYSTEELSSEVIEEVNLITARNINNKTYTEETLGSLNRIINTTNETALEIYPEMLRSEISFDICHSANCTNDRSFFENMNFKNIYFRVNINGSRFRNDSIELYKCLIMTTSENNLLEFVYEVTGYIEKIEKRIYMLELGIFPDAFDLICIFDSPSESREGRSNEKITLYARNVMPFGDLSFVMNENYQLLLILLFAVAGIIATSFILYAFCYLRRSVKASSIID